MIPTTKPNYPEVVVRLLEEAARIALEKWKKRKNKEKKS
jgi:hypothetical protein